MLRSDLNLHFNHFRNLLDKKLHLLNALKSLLKLVPKRPEKIHLAGLLLEVDVLSLDLQLLELK